jgi:hypothetical protein
MTLACLSTAQSVSPDVASFIRQFSFAATRVDMKANEKGVLPHLSDLGKTLLALAKTDDKTLAAAFPLLDKNESTERLVAGDLLFLLMFQLPDNTDWSKPGNMALRNVLAPTYASGVADSGTDKAYWPWIDDGKEQWHLGPFRVVPGSWDKSLTSLYTELRAKYKRRIWFSAPETD